jgi:hypothetical protein
MCTDFKPEIVEVSWKDNVKKMLKILRVWRCGSSSFGSR